MQEENEKNVQNSKERIKKESSKNIFEDNQNNRT